MSDKSLIAGAFRKGDVLLVEDTPGGPRSPFVIVEVENASPRLGEVTFVDSQGRRRSFGATDHVPYSVLSPTSK